MKNKLKITIGIIIFSAIMAINLKSGIKGNENSRINANINTALSQIDPECPNGCLVDEGEGCYCYGWYPYSKEAEWPDEDHDEPNNN